MKGKLTKMPRAEQWASRICAQLSKSVESIIDVGRLLVDAQKDLAHGEWDRFFDEQLVPFKRHMARLYMNVAENQLLANGKHVHLLPPAIGTLAQLASADESKLRNAFKDGVIKPDMKRSDVKALLPTLKKNLADQVIQTSSSDDDAVTDQRLQQSLDATREKLDEAWERFPRHRATIQAAISSWGTYFDFKRQAEQ